MRLLIENGSYSMRNMGDTAMLMVAVRRLRKIFPDAEMLVFTSAPERLKKLIPCVTPYNIEGRNYWLTPRTAYGSVINRLLSYSPLRDYAEVAGMKSMMHGGTALSRFMLKVGRSCEIDAQKQFLRDFSTIDAVIATGGGYLTDAFYWNAMKVLATIGAGTYMQKPTFLFGQGIGPLHNTRLLNLAKYVLPRASTIALREKRIGPSILENMGIPKKHVVVTGDDAIELAYEFRRKELGNVIGINLRVTEYSGISSSEASACISIINESAKKLHTSLMPIPISLDEETNESSDACILADMLELHHIEANYLKHIEHPTEVIQRVSQCRLVVTGSYHAGVFALSQGIPVIGIIKSPYYYDKFMGLSDQFTGGCKVLSDAQITSKDLEQSIEKMWYAAPAIHDSILKAAEQQICLSKSAFNTSFCNFKVQ